MGETLIYASYAVAALLAAAVYCALPRERRPARPVLTVLVSGLALGVLVMLLGRLLGDAADKLYFSLLSLLAVLTAMRVVTHPKPVYSAVYFVAVVLSTAGLIVLAGAEFLAAALVIVYAGAILVTYVFVIMMAQQSVPPRSGPPAVFVDYDRISREPAAAVLAGFVLTATLAGVIVGHDWPASGQASAAACMAAEGNTLALGRVLLGETGFAVSVQLAGVLLMAAMVGAIAIARKRLPRTKDEGETLPPGEIGKRVKPF